jgi:hypothetical protein
MITFILLVIIQFESRQGARSPGRRAGWRREPDAGGLEGGPSATGRDGPASAQAACPTVAAAATSIAEVSRCARTPREFLAIPPPPQAQMAGEARLERSCRASLAKAGDRWSADWSNGGLPSARGQGGSLTSGPGCHDPTVDDARLHRTCTAGARRVAAVPGGALAAFALRLSPSLGSDRQELARACAPGGRATVGRESRPGAWADRRPGDL